MFVLPVAHVISVAEAHRHQDAFCNAGSGGCKGARHQQHESAAVAAAERTQ